MMLVGSLTHQLSGQIDARRNAGPGSRFTVTTPRGDNRPEANS
jgi:signal transduction histidine kinase